MARSVKGRGRKGSTAGGAKVKVKVVHREQKRKLIHVVVPPGGTTGLHTEKRDYVVVPLSSGPLSIEIHRKVGGKLRKTTQVLQLKRGKPYKRKVGRGGIRVNITNKSGKHHRFLKDFD